MKIALLGYGKMGKEIEKIASERNHDIFLKIDSEKDWETKKTLLKEADLAIDFSMPDNVLLNINFCFEYSIPMVIGTTGWYDQLEKIESMCKNNNQSLLYSPNFSIGVNIFFEVNKKLAYLMNNFMEYEVSIEEIHHVHKIDAPSGTAISLANDLIKILERKEKWVHVLSQTDKEFEIKSVRIENTPGTHIIKYDSEIDTIEIKHVAKNRKGFALGAVLAAEWLKGKQGFFKLNDMLNF